VKALRASILTIPAAALFKRPLPNHGDQAEPPSAPPLAFGRGQLPQFRLEVGLAAHLSITALVSSGRLPLGLPADETSGRRLGRLSSHMDTGNTAASFNLTR
jgi:hypothetical protein